MHTESNGLGLLLYQGTQLQIHENFVEKQQNLKNFLGKTFLAANAR